MGQSSWATKTNNRVIFSICLGMILKVRRAHVPTVPPKSFKTSRSSPQWRPWIRARTNSWRAVFRTPKTLYHSLMRNFPQKWCGGVVAWHGMVWHTRGNTKDGGENGRCHAHSCRCRRCCGLCGLWKEVGIGFTEKSASNWGEVYLWYIYIYIYIHILSIIYVYIVVHTHVHIFLRSSTPERLKFDAFHFDFSEPIPGWSAGRKRSQH